MQSVEIRDLLTGVGLDGRVEYEIFLARLYPVGRVEYEIFLTRLYPGGRLEYDLLARLDQTVGWNTTLPGLSPV
jgi:hypothetical protein